MSSPAHLRKGFRSRLESSGIVLPGVFNALTAKLAQRAGFEGLYISGAALSAAAGLPDVGLLTLSEFTAAAGSIARATSLACLCDADTGFGEAVNVSRCVEEYERAGLAGLHIEDQVLPKKCGHLAGKRLIPRRDMERKIRAAVLSRSDGNFLVIARTDARSVEGFAGAVERARAYAAAGADAIFPEALKTREEFAAFARRVSAPLMANMTEFGVSPLLSAGELFELGYRLVIFPVGALRAAMKACEGFYKTLRERGTQRDWLSRMQTRDELYELLGYDGYARLDRAASRRSGRRG